MSDYLDTNRRVFAFRRAVPKELQPFILTASGKPRTEWRYSLLTTDRARAGELCRIEAVKTDGVLDKARQDRRARLAREAKPAEQRERESREWAEFFDHQEERSKELAAEEAEFEAREGLALD